MQLLCAHELNVLLVVMSESEVSQALANIVCVFSKDVGVTNVLFSAQEKFLAAALRYIFEHNICRLT